MGLAKQVVITGAIVGCAAIAIAKLPPWLVERGNESASACLDAAARNHADPSACRPGVGFAIGAVFPHVRVHARALRRDLDRRRAHLAVEHALATGVGAHEAIAATLDRARSTGGLEDELHWLLVTLSDDGALEELAHVEIGDAHVSDAELPARAAIALGDLALARERVPPEADIDWLSGARDGALACLLGQRARGLAMLATADHAWVAGGRDPDGGTRLAALHCGGVPATLGFDPTNVSSVDKVQAMLVRAYDPAFQAGRRNVIGFELAHDSSIFWVDYAGAIALAASGPTEPTLEQMLELADRFDERVPKLAAITPYDVLAPDDESHPVVAYVPPSWLAAAAPRFEHAASVAPATLPDDATYRLSEGALGHPRELLRRVAAVMYRDAALFQLRRGDRKGLDELLARARALDPADLGRAPIELAAGAAKASLATIDQWAAAHPDAGAEEHAAAEIMRVLALAASGELSRASEVAKGIDTIEAEWLQLALALALGQPTPPMRTATTHELSPGECARAIAAQRLPDDGWLPRTGRRVLPAVLVAVAGAAKASGRDPERVIDRYFAADVDSRAFMLARAEAARWRKDDAAVARWQARAAAIESLFVDDHAAALGAIGGLW